MIGTNSIAVCICIICIISPVFADTDLSINTSSADNVSNISDNYSAFQSPEPLTVSPPPEKNSQVEQNASPVNASDNLTGETTSSKEKYYASISDIIKAHDWAALQNYSDSLKAAHPEAFSDPSPSTAGDWEKRFPIITPTPIAVSCCS